MFPRGGSNLFPGMFPMLASQLAKNARLPPESTPALGPMLGALHE